MKAWLSLAGVSFTVRDVDEDPAAYDELIAMGVRRIPLTRVGQTGIIGFDPDALAQATGRRP